MPGTAERDLQVQTGVDYGFLERALEALANPVRLRLLAFLVAPHYLEEIGAHLGQSRQGARKHLDALTEAGLVERRPGTRPTGPVTEYLLNPQGLFLVHDEFGKLGALKPSSDDAVMVRTRVEGGPRGASPVAGGPCFHVVGGFAPGLRTALTRRDGPPWTLGRDGRCAVVVGHDPYASNRHAEVRWEQGRHVVVDLASTNGTQHNWATLPRGGSAALRHGDVVGVGRTLLLFWDAALPG